MKERLRALADLIRDESRKGNPAYIKMLEEGHRDWYLEEIAFIQEHQGEWL